MPRCWAHSPTASTPGRLVRIASSTMIPRSQTMPIERASSVSGRMPIETTTRSAMQLRAVGEAQAVGAVGADDLLRVAVELDVDVEAAQRRRQQRAGAGVELALHEPVEQVHDGHGAALRGDAARGLEAEQAAADDRRALDAALAAARRIASQSAGSRNGCTPSRSMPGIGGISGCEPVAMTSLSKRQLVDVVEPEHAALGVDPRDHAADEQLDVVVGVPLARAQLERLGILAADEDLRQPDAVVRRAALAADERDGDVASRSRSASQTAWPAIPPPTMTTPRFMSASWATRVSSACRECFHPMNGGARPATERTLCG